MALSESLARRLHPDVFKALEQSSSKAEALETELAAAKEEGGRLSERVADLEGQVATLTDEMNGVAVYVWRSSDLNEVDRIILSKIHAAGGTLHTGEILRDIAATKSLTLGTLDKLFRLGLLSEKEEDAKLSPWAKRLMDLSADCRAAVGTGVGGKEQDEAAEDEDGTDEKPEERPTITVPGA